jgi:peroxiredoxin
VNARSDIKILSTALIENVRRALAPPDSYAMQFTTTASRLVQEPEPHFDLVERFSFTEVKDGERFDCKWVRKDFIDGKLLPSYDNRSLWDGKRYIRRQQFLGLSDPEGKLPVSATTSASRDRIRSLFTMYPRGSFLDGWYAGEFRSLGDVLLSQEDIRIAPEMYEVNGHQCYYLTASGPHGHFEVWVDPVLGYQVRKAVVTKGEDALYYGQPAKEQGRTQVRGEYEIDDFEELGGRFFAKHGMGTVTSTSEAGKTETVRVEATRSEIDLEPDFEALAAFEMDLPDGIRVTDRETRQAHIWDQGRLIPLDEFKVQRMTGSEAPDLNVAAWVRDESTSLASLRDETVVLAFWDNSYEACAEMVQLLNRLLVEYPGKGVQFLSIHSADADLGALKGFISDKSIKFRVAVDKPAENYKGATFEKYRVTKLPAVFIIDADGRVRYQDIPLEAVEQAVKSLLDEQ